MDTSNDFESFKTEATKQGFDEVLERVWAPAAVIPSHGHPFAVKALIAAGEMWLTVGDQIRHLRTGDEFTLASGELHAERYGEKGATLWAARRHAAGAS